MATSRAQKPSLESLFDSGEFADLTVATGDYSFKVHKNIVRTASPWFRAACAKKFQEAQTGLVTLPESSTVVKCLLLHSYGLKSRIKDEIYADSDFGARIPLCVDVYVAADKYGNGSLVSLMADQARAELRFSCDLDPRALVEVGSRVFAETTGCLGGIFAHVTAVHLDKVVKDDVPWQMLTSNQDYSRLVMECITKSRGFGQLSDIMRKGD